MFGIIYHGSNADTFLHRNLNNYASAEMSYTSFADLLHSLDGYVDEIDPYAVAGSTTIFPSLPLELREHMFSYILPTHIRSIDPLDNDARSWQYFECYNIFQVNHATRLDVGLWYILTHEFELGNEDSCAVFSRFLEWFPGEQGFRRVRRLEMRKFWTRSALDLITRCENIMTLKLWFYPEIFTQYPDSKVGTHIFPRELMKAEEAARNYTLARLFCMRNPRRVELLWFRPWRYCTNDYEHDLYVRVSDASRRGEGEFRRRMEDLRTWLIRGFAASGREVVVELAPI